MKRVEKEGLAWLEFELFAPYSGMRHAVMLRHGGVSQGPYGSLNLSTTMGDDPNHVAENIARVQKVLQVDLIAAGRQVHGNLVRQVDGDNFNNCGECDGLMTNVGGVALKVGHADCQAAIFYDPVQHAIAAVHCGWRGHVSGIYSEAVRAMAQAYSSKASDLRVAIAPSLGPCHAEFIHFRSEFPQPFWQFQVVPNYFNLWALGQWQLQEAGILPHHIQVAQQCTYADNSDCFSYRRSGGTTGAHATIAMLTD